VNGWIKNPLGVLCDIELGRTPPRANARYWDPEKRTANVWLSIADLLNIEDKQVNDSKEYLSSDGAAISRPVPKGTLLASFKLTLGRLAFAGRALYTNEAIAALSVRNENELSKQFLYYYLHYFDWMKAAEADLKIKGFTLNKAKLKELKVRYPTTLAEQHRIVSLLDKAFERIATAKANAEKNLRNARVVSESYVESVFAKRGADWQQSPLRELCDIKHGFTFKSKYFTSKGDYVLLTPGNFYESGGYRDRGEKQKYYDGPIPNGNGFVLKGGDLLVAMTEQAAGLLGSPILVPESVRFLHNQRLGLVIKKPHVPWINEFFFYVFNLRRVRAEIHDSASGVKVRHTSPTKIGDVIVAFPNTISVQKRLVSTFALVFEEGQKLESIYEQKVSALDALKKSLLDRAFSGQL
jgi:type I restriction enzyme S subunit